MLNRRILRGKVMQFLYAFKQVEASELHQAHNFFRDFYAPDLNSMEVQDPAKLEAQRKKATEAFDKNYKSSSPEFTEEDLPMRKVVLEAMENYKRSVEKDRKFYLNLMVDSTERLYDLYIRCLVFPSELHKYFISGEDVKTMSKIFLNEHPDFFSNNAIFKKLTEHQELGQWQIRKNLYWEKEILRKTVIEQIDKEEDYKNLLLKYQKDFEEQKELMLQLFKKYFFQNPYVQEYFEENETNWSENKAIVKSMVLKTVKGIKEEGDPLELLELSSNWEEDKEFFIELYTKALENDDYFEEIISKHSKHWDIERVALLDKVILKLALAEMINFPSIPVKVTINEFIELSKIYSTPKSKQFVNGILDKLSSELVEEGVIRKSGRGLIDNK